MNWENIERINQEFANELQEALGITDPISHFLIQRKITTVKEASDFLKPNLNQVTSPFLIANLQEAVELLIDTIVNKRTVGILGDYDVDGITGASLLSLILQEFGLKPKCFTPNRFDDGYGLSISVLEKVLKDYLPEVFIVIDCGTNSSKEVEFLKNKGVKNVLVIDHHKNNVSQLPDCLVINPHVIECQDEKAKYLCSVGLVFKLAHGLIKQLRENEETAEQKDEIYKYLYEKSYAIKLKNYLSFVAMGTVADLVPLRGDNRVFAKFGIELLANSSFPGIQALIQVTGMQNNRTVLSTDISFRIAPRINVSGRLTDASLPLKMLLSKNFEEAIHLADVLDNLNRERQMIEQDIVKEAVKMIPSDIPDALVLFDPKWHSGVVGIVAGKFAQDLKRPIVVLGKEGDILKGSVRGISQLNLIEILDECKHMLASWGGHPQAVGISLKEDNLEEFRELFCLSVKNAKEAFFKRTGQSVHDLENILKIFWTFDSSEITMKLFDEIELLQPFGNDNPQPIFAIKNVVINDNIMQFGNSNEHIRFRINLPVRETTQVIGWKMSNNRPPVKTMIDLAVKIGWNYWKNQKLPQLELLDWKYSEN